MKIVTTKEYFLQKKDAFKADLIRMSENNDKDGLTECIQDCLDEVFGEEYKGQFSESEVHILNSLLKALDLNAKSFINTTHEIIKDAPQTSNPFSNKSNLGALVGLGVGILLSALFISESKPLLCGLTIGATTIAGGMITSNNPKPISKSCSYSLVDVDKVIADIEILCHKVDSFMSICSVQIDKLKR